MAILRHKCLLAAKRMSFSTFDTVQLQELPKGKRFGSLFCRIEGPNPVLPTDREHLTPVVTNMTRGDRDACSDPDRPSVSNGVVPVDSRSEPRTDDALNYAISGTSNPFRYSRRSHLLADSAFSPVKRPFAGSSSSIWLTRSSALSGGTEWA